MEIKSDRALRIGQSGMDLAIANCTAGVTTSIRRAAAEVPSKGTQGRTLKPPKMTWIT